MFEDLPRFKPDLRSTFVVDTEDFPGIVAFYMG